MSAISRRIHLSREVPVPVSVFAPARALAAAAAALAILMGLASCATDRLAPSAPKGVDLTGEWQLNPNLSDDPQKPPPDDTTHPSEMRHHSGRQRSGLPPFGNPGGAGGPTGGAPPGSDDFTNNADVRSGTYVPTLWQTSGEMYVPTLWQTSGETYVPTLSQTSGETYIPTLSQTSGETYVPTLWQTSGETYVPTLSQTSGETYIPTLSQTSGETYVPTLKQTSGGTYIPTLSQTSGETYVPTLSQTSGGTYIPTLWQIPGGVGGNNPVSAGAGTATGPSSTTDATGGKARSRSRANFGHWLDAPDRMKIEQNGGKLTIQGKMPSGELKTDEFVSGHTSNIPIGQSTADRDVGWRDNIFVIDTKVKSGPTMEEDYALDDEGHLILSTFMTGGHMPKADIKRVYDRVHP